MPPCDRQGKALNMCFIIYSIKSCFCDLKQYLLDIERNFDIVCISESWLTNNDDLNDYSIDFYETVVTNRSNKRGGGVMIYVSKSLNFKVVEQMTECVDDFYECISIEIDVNRGKNIIVSCLYRTLGSCVDLFNEYLEKLLQRVKKNKLFYLVGDFNINLIKSETHLGTRNFIDLLFSHGLYPLINKPTRICLEAATLIDNIFTNCLLSTKNGILINDISDHLPVFSITEIQNFDRKCTETDVLKRKIDSNSICELNEKLLNHNWSEIFVSSNVDEAYNGFINVIQNAFNTTCPLKKIKQRTCNSKPWVTKGLANAFKKQKTLYKRFLKNRTKDNEQKYKAYKNRLINIKRFSQKEYYSNLLEVNKNNIKETWNILNNIINKKAKKSQYPQQFNDSNGNIITDKTTAANKFNEFFVNVGPKLASKIKQEEERSIFDYMGPANEKCMFLEPVDIHEILTTIDQCKNKRSEDYNNLSMNVIKGISQSVIQPFTHICNLSFSTGVVPKNMKIAKVIPLFKSGNKSLFTNYRPVALLPQFSKILEKLFCKRLNRFIEKFDLISENQYGFRSARSTSTALLELVEELTSSMDNGNFTVGVFIDLSKAFDTIDHNLLLKKLENFGIRGIALNWLKSYLADRQQYVMLNSHSSDLLSVVCGVPQGSVLGPLLFILYINDINKVSNVLKLILFADDTNLFKSGYDLSCLCNEISNELSKLYAWFNVNKLSLNVTKTNYMIFSNKKIVSNVCVKINDDNIERVECTKFLGIMIDSKLTWKTHIVNVKRKLSKCLAILYRCNILLNENALKTLYCSMFLSYLTYCCEVWGTTYKTNLKCLELLQKKAVRIICKAGKTASTTPLFLKLNLLKLDDIVKFKCCSLMYYAYRLELPSNLQRKFNVSYYEENQYNLRSKCKFKVNYARTTKRQHCLSVFGVKIYNSLPNDIASLPNIHLFKKYLKNHILGKYSSICLTTNIVI